MRELVIGALRLYRYGVSPFLPSACRYQPTCSTFMREAVERYGTWRGICLGIGRILRCHPFNAGGFDPVP